MKRLLIEAPGAVGEARLVARHIRTLLAAGATSASIVVCHRDLVSALPLLKEVFDDHHVPMQSPIAKSLKHSPAIAFLKRAWQLPRQQFRFQPLTALLRNNFFQPPNWPAETPLKAEQLLRHLGVPRHREDYLAAISRRIDAPFPTLEDEHADAEWQKWFREQLALHRPFYVWLFDRWNERLETAEPRRHVERLRLLSNDLGVKDDADVERLLAELQSWSESDSTPLSSAEFEAKWNAILSETIIDEAGDESPRVRLMVPEAAAESACDHLIMMGLGERSFPRFDGNPDTTLATEQDLWSRLRATPAQSLTLSYPAVDARGQALLPSPFLGEFNTANTLPRFKQRMLIERYAEGPAYSAAEQRVQYVRAAIDSRRSNLGDPGGITAISRGLSEAIPPDAGGNSSIPEGSQQAVGLAAIPPGSMAKTDLSGGVASLNPRLIDAIPPGSKHENVFSTVRKLNLSADTIANLHTARRMAAARFGDNNLNSFNGVLKSQPLIDAVAKKFDTKTFSPTALERYIACPFHFWLRDVLRLEPPDEPGEEVEATHRGTVVHRALSRFHGASAGDLPRELNAAVDEDVERTPSRILKAIWQLERRRLARYFGRYPGQWQEFQALCTDSESPVPVPKFLEMHIGVKHDQKTVHPPLEITYDGVTVRIGGVIDRVDVADLTDGRGYWILDYKTGKASSYTGSAIKSFEKLQLPLYALAVEAILPDARPLGLGYWLVTDGGVKPVLPDKRSLKTWSGDAAPWHAFRETLQHWVVQLVKQLRRGDFRLAPRSRSTCDHCPYGGVCRINQLRRRAALPMELPVME